MSRSIKTAIQKQWKIIYDDVYDRPGEWQQWYAWCPVKTIHDEWVCRENVFRRKAKPHSYDENNNKVRYEYGNIFDVLKE
jgi:hypothetical protein